MTDTSALAEALARTLETGGPEPLASLLAPDAVVWHNTDRRELSADEALAGIAVLQQIARDVRADVLGRHDIDGGFALRVVLGGTVASHGGAIELHNCLIVSVAAGLITRIDEYVDPNGAAQFAPPLE